MNDRDQRLNEVAGIAAALEKQTGCPARLMIAQWALESEWGAKRGASDSTYFQNIRFPDITPYQSALVT